MHHDLKTQNILLDSEFHVKVRLGLQRRSGKIRGSNFTVQRKILRIREVRQINVEKSPLDEMGGTKIREREREGHVT